VCSESGLPDDLSWGRLGYIRWLDTAQDLCHSKVTHPLDHTDFTKALGIDTNYAAPYHPETNGQV